MYYKMYRLQKLMNKFKRKGKEIKTKIVSFTEFLFLAQVPLKFHWYEDVKGTCGSLAHLNNTEMSTFEPKKKRYSRRTLYCSAYLLRGNISSSYVLYTYTHFRLPKFLVKQLSRLVIYLNTLLANELWTSRYVHMICSRDNSVYVGAKVGNHHHHHNHWNNTRRPSAPVYLV